MIENSVVFTPEKSKKIALARLDLLNQWKEFRRKSDNKLQLINKLEIVAKENNLTEITKEIVEDII
ncbi:MAG: hypothetical protein MRZ90_02455 [Candidatus Gastranaerophilales bacterium]|nr:hypothetical protein [Candidatus Gastranaerophilales bacterium]